MIVLALDTTGRAGSAAVVRDGVVLAESSGDPAATHGERLPAALIALLEAAQVTLDAVDLLAVAAGPGSFTGLRVGIAAMQGVAMATGTPIVPVSTLEALARVGSTGAHLVAPWVDAQRGEVFAALYQAGGRDPLDEPSALTPTATLEAIVARRAGQPVRFIGDGALRYAETIGAALGSLAQVDLVVPRLAASIALIAAEAPHRAVAPHALMPMYVRRPDAELARERRARQA